jgi:hypothetical protein
MWNSHATRLQGTGMKQGGGGYYYLSLKNMVRAVAMIFCSAKCSYLIFLSQPILKP